MTKIVTSCAAIVATLMLHPSTGLGAPPSDPCALLTTAQVSAALGAPVGGGKSLATTVCQWLQQGKPGDELLKLDVTLVTIARFTRLKTVTLGTVTNVGGLGDEAFYSTFKTTNTTLTTLNVKKGDAAVVIQVSGGKKPAEEYQTKEKAVAQVLVPKL
jgi:hypothetical protein